jgi:hypothetical protein
VVIPVSFVLARAVITEGSPTMSATALPYRQRPARASEGFPPELADVIDD